MKPSTSKKNPFETLELLSERSGLALAEDLFSFSFVADKLKVLPYSFVKKHALIPLEEVEGILHIAVSDPYNLEAIEEIRYMTGSFVKEHLASLTHIEEAIAYCYGNHGEESSKVIQSLDAPKPNQVSLESEIEYDLLDGESDSVVVQVFNTVLIEAVSIEASDIHFEPVENGLIVRYRVDGVLQEKHTLSKDLLSPLTTRMKVLAQLDIAEHRLPQDGRIRLKMGGRDIDFRISVVPVVYGERIVLRILDKSQISLGLDRIGMGKETLQVMRSHIRKNQGILLVTGPTGSGKTTTLYSALSEIRSPEVNIMTIEDPVEFKLEGMAQIGVNPKIKLTFAAGLRHILRQDPDVVMIGEIRDRETAEIAIQASLTGHLVLTTLHTNDAPSAIARLIDMGVEPYLLSSSLIAVVAQRLVRCICSHCKTSYEPSPMELVDLKMKPTKSLRLYRGVGCSECLSTGYKGRYGIYELMNISKGLKEQILKSADANKIQKIAIEEGMKILRQEGMALALKGITTLEEVIRVTRALDEEVDTPSP
ncbi:MAG: type II secretion system ATPase GspE [Verrucomicrobia bacterium]|nr:type II secretion system ATPase GspE [Verrucomicrobiota bacterium]